MNRFGLAVLVLVTGCFSSIVDDPCAAGFHFTEGRCLAADGPDAGTSGGDDDGGTGGGDHDAGPTGGDDGGTGLVCSPPELLCDGACIDVMSDPLNCGACNHVCASGICEMGACVGELPGHIVAIGHDYQSHNAAMARVLGNAAALGSHHDVGIARLKAAASAASSSGTSQALTQAMSSMGRPWHNVALPVPGQPLAGADVLIVDAQGGEGQTAHDAGVAWAPSINNLLARGGVVVVLDGAETFGYQFANGASLYTFAAPVDATGTPAFVSDAQDAVVQGVVTPYLADTTSAVFPGVSGAIATPDGAVVVHQTR